MKKQIGFLFISIISLFLFTAGCTQPQSGTDNTLKNNSQAPQPKYKNVIIMVPDGCSMSIETFARLFKGSDINLDSLHTGSVRTFAANSIITDSSAAATAFATGHKTTTSFLGVAPVKETLLPFYTPEFEPYHPLATILEGAKYNGKATGLVVTSVINHATPGGFSAHSPSRHMSDDIMEQIVYQDIDVVLGGGGSILIPENTEFTSAGGNIWKGKRKDSENLIDVLKNRGYSFVSSRDELLSTETDKMWGIFNNTNLAPDIDRDELNPSQPSLAEMTEKAISILSKNENGFFMLVEGSQVDYGGHANDPVYMVTEMLAFDDAVGAAVDYAKTNNDTLVVIFPDHDTGGLSIGNNSEAGRKYASTPFDVLIKPFKNAQMTVQGVLELAYRDNKATKEEMQELFKAKWDLDLNEAQAEEILKYKRFPYAVANYISNNFTIIGWTTAGHTGVDVPLWVYPSGPDSPIAGNIDNTDITRKVTAMMDIDLAYTQKELFVDAMSVFPEAEIISEKEGFVLNIGNCRIPANKDIVEKDGKIYRTKGVTVYIQNTGKTFIPEEAVNIIKGEN